MATRELARADLLDRLHGCWLGQQIGATLGTPLDGRAIPAALRFYDPVPGQASASQEIDFQLAWLDLLRTKGSGITSGELAEQWEAHVAYTYDELGWARWNIRRGLRPPLSGGFNNWFKHASAGMGRALIWSMASPAAPQLAAELAWQDAILDHTGEGLWAAMFWAASGSAAFVVREVPEILEIGLAMVPATCRVANAVRAARDSFRLAQTPLQARDAVTAAAASGNVTDAAQNSGLVAIGLLYGKGDFGLTVTTTVNAGFNARVNGTLTGGIAGIMQGRIGIPKEWADPIGDAVIYGWGLHLPAVDTSTPDLATHTLEAAEALLSARGADVRVVDGVAPEPAPPAAMPEPAPPPAADEEELIGDRARFLEIEPAPPASVAEPSAAPAPDAMETPGAAAPAEAAGPAEAAAPVEAAVPMAPPAERAEVSDTTKVAEPLPSDAAAAPAAPEPAAETAPAPGTPTTAETIATAPTPELADVFEPSPAPIAAVALPGPDLVLSENERAKELLVRSSTTALCHEGAFEFTVDYGVNGPVLLPGVATNFTVAVRNAFEEDFVGTITLSTPPGWQVAVPGAQAQRQMIAKGRMARFGFVVRAPEEASLTGTNDVQIVLTPNNAAPTACDVTFLGGNCWWVAGPFPNQGEEGYDRVFPVEDRPGLEEEYLGRGGSMVRWQRMAFRENVMDFEPTLGGFSGVLYAATVLHLPLQTEARIVIHSSDGVQAWLNGQRFLRLHAHEGFRPTVSQSPMMADVTFKPGANRVMLKIVRCREPLQFAFVVTDRNGVPLDDLGNTKWEPA